MTPISAKRTALILAAAVIVILPSTISYLFFRRHFGPWKVSATQEVPWTPFYWVNDSIGGKYRERIAMNIPCKLKGLGYHFSMQFDTGSDATMIYGNSLLMPDDGDDPAMPVIARLNSWLQFWNGKKSIKNITILMNNLELQTEDCYVLEHHGSTALLNDTSTTIHLGTVGVDILLNKVLIIDYPKQRFAICEGVPKAFDTNLVDIDLDKFGRVILPMVYNGQTYDVMFDTGSSIFPLTTSEQHISSFSKSNDIDTLQITSWGQKHAVTGKLMGDSFQLGGGKFSRQQLFTPITLVMALMILQMQQPAMHCFGIASSSSTLRIRSSASNSCANAK